MRLIFKPAPIHTLAWLAVTSGFGVGAVRIDPGHWEKVEEADEEREHPTFRGQDGKPMRVKVRTRKVTRGTAPFIAFDFHGEKWDVDAVLELAKDAGLELVEKRDDVAARRESTRIFPKVAATATGGP